MTANSEVFTCEKKSGGSCIDSIKGKKSERKLLGRNNEWKPEQDGQALVGSMLG